jgi:lectin-like protein
VFRLGPVLLVAACYVPVPPEGAPCQTDQECPTPQRCVANACSTHARTIDAAVVVDTAPAIDTAVVPTDAPPDAMLPCTNTGLDCPNGTVVIPCGTACYVLCKTAVAYSAAETSCHGWSGALAEIDDATQQQCLQQKLTGNTWVGLQQLDTATTPGDGWTWNGVKPLTFTHWQNGTPNDADGNENHSEQCAKMQTDGTWDDVPCTDRYPFFCGR